MVHISDANLGTKKLLCKWFWTRFTSFAPFMVTFVRYS